MSAIHLLPEVQTAPTIEERRVRDMERAVARLERRDKAMTWVVLVFGAVIILLIWGVFP